MRGPVTVSVTVTIRSAKWFGVNLGPWFIGVARLDPISTDKDKLDRLREEATR